MRILFIGGFYRGFLLAKRLIERGENVVGGFIYEEDAHESPKYNRLIESEFTAAKIWNRITRKITAAQLPKIRDELAPDIIFCLGWRTVIPMEVLQSAPLGGVAVHDSLLPRLRGFAPTSWGLILGHDKLGATLFQLTDSVDAGDIFFQGAISARPDETFESIQERIAEVSVGLFDKYLDASKSGPPRGRAQDHSQATYTCARTPADGAIDWQCSSIVIERLVRALQAPLPGAFTFYRGTPLIIDQANNLDGAHTYEGRIPGRIIDRDPAAGTVDVLCGDGVLRIARVRTADGKGCEATAVMKSVRESLGFNATEEISQLRSRLDNLEASLCQLEPRQITNKAG